VLGKSGKMHTDMECEAETEGAAGVFLMPPQPPQVNNPPNPPPSGGGEIVPPGNPWFPPIVNPPNNLDCTGDLGRGNGPYSIYWDKSLIEAGETAYCYFPCGIRSNAAIYKAEMRLYAQWGGDAFANMLLTAIDANKNDLFFPLTISPPSGGLAYFVFGPPSAMGVAGFKLAVSAGGSTITYQRSNDLIASVSISGTSEAWTNIPGLTPGDWYYAEGAGGPWYTPQVGGGPQAWTYIYSLSVVTGAVASGGVRENLGGMMTTATNIPRGDYVGNYARFLFQATNSNQVRCFDAPGAFTDNTGAMIVNIYKARTISSRRVQIASTQIYNICQA
jgi:hypothetical protein